MAESLDCKPQPRSLNHCERSFVIFKNRCDRKAALYWYNYQGSFVRYAVLEKGMHMQMDTYVTHPWGARDAETGDMLLINKDTVYYPGSHLDYKLRPIIYIDIPVYSLLDRCKQITKKIYTDLDATDLELPKSLMMDLKEKRKVKFVTYEQYLEQKKSE